MSTNEKIIYAVFTGGGSQLRNIEELIAENIPGIKMRIATNPLAEFSINHEHKHKEEISPILLGLIKNGKQNCCHEEQYINSATGMQEIFSEKEFNTTSIHNKERDYQKEPEESPVEIEYEIPTVTEEAEKKEEQVTSQKHKKKKKSSINIKAKLIARRVNKTFKSILNGTMTYVDNATKTEDEVNFDDTPTENK